MDFCTGASKSEKERQRSMSDLRLCCRLDCFFLVGGEREKEMKLRGASHSDC